MSDERPVTHLDTPPRYRTMVAVRGWTWYTLPFKFSRVSASTPATCVPPATDTVAGVFLFPGDVPGVACQWYLRGIRPQKNWR